MDVSRLWIIHNDEQSPTLSDFLPMTISRESAVLHSKMPSSEHGGIIRMLRWENEKNEKLSHILRQSSDNLSQIP